MQQIPSEFKLSGLIKEAFEYIDACMTYIDNKGTPNENIIDAHTDLVNKIIDSTEQFPLMHLKSALEYVIATTLRGIKLSYRGHSDAILGRLTSSSPASDIDSSLRGIVSMTANVVQNNIGRNLGGQKIDFEEVCSIWQMYWSMRHSLAHIKPERHRAFPVLRLNAIPFAESVFTELIRLGANQHAVTVEVVNDLKWPDVGVGLLSGRVDVALYNTAIMQQLLAAKHHSDRYARKLVFRSSRVARYQTYYILERKDGYSTEEQPVLSVPWRSDFQQHINIMARNSDDGSPFLEISNSTREKILKLDIRTQIRFCDSADEALALAIDKEVSHCMVGGIQHEFAINQFGNMIHLYGELTYNSDAAETGEDIHFWVAVDRKEEAENIIKTMVAIWNNEVADRWMRLGGGGSSNESIEKEHLLTSVNSQLHTVFVNDFECLRSLINKCNASLELVDYNYHPITL